MNLDEQWGDHHPMEKMVLKPTQRLWLHKLVADMPPLDAEAGPWVAGGSVRSVAVKGDMSDVRDIDVFFTGTEQFARWEPQLRKLGWKQVIPTSDVKHADSYWAFRSPDGKRLAQLIVGWFNPTMEKTLNGFSITACQFATDGKDIWTGRHSLYHVQQKWFVPVTASRMSRGFVGKYFGEYGYKSPGGKGLEEFLLEADWELAS